MDRGPIIDEILGGLYRADVVLSGQGWRNTLRRARERVAADQELRAAMVARRDSLLPVVRKRSRGDTAHIETKMVGYIGDILESEHA